MKLKHLPIIIEKTNKFLPSLFRCNQTEYKECVSKVIFCYNDGSNSKPYEVNTLDSLERLSVHIMSSIFTNKDSPSEMLLYGYSHSIKITNTETNLVISLDNKLLMSIGNNWKLYEETMLLWYGELQCAINENRLKIDKNLAIPFCIYPNLVSENGIML